MVLRVVTFKSERERGNEVRVLWKEGHVEAEDGRGRGQGAKSP